MKSKTYSSITGATFGTYQIQITKPSSSTDSAILSFPFFKKMNDLMLMMANHRLRMVHRYIESEVAMYRR